MEPIERAIADYYERAPEEHRLEAGASLLESLRTRELILRHAPKAPATVVDVGGAAGPYALWLADLGYVVHLVEPAPRLLEEARRRSSASARPLASCTSGDARRLEWPDASADILLLLGPLYHLTSSSDREEALREAVRVLKPGGFLFAAGISRYASALAGFVEDSLDDPQFAAIVEQDLRDGQHRNNTGRTQFFTTAYLHRPEDLRAEIVASGLMLEGLYGIEGPGWLVRDIGAQLEDAGRRERVLRVARMLESVPSVIGLSAHLLAVAHKPR